MSAYLDIRVKNGLSFPNSSGLKVLEQYDPIYFIRLYIDSDKEYTKLHDLDRHWIPNAQWCDRRAVWRFRPGRNGNGHGRAVYHGKSSG